MPVMMSVWQRIHLLERTLRQLENQRDVTVHFYLLNNNHLLKREIEFVVCHADNQYSCFSRFVWMSELCHLYPFFVVIDDDQAFGLDLLRTLWKEKIWGDAVGSHARSFTPGKSYWHKRPSPLGQLATYCGPGGMIIDSRLLGARRLLECPEEYMMMDDIWLSYVLDHHLGAPMLRSSVEIATTDHAGDTWWRISDQKTACLEALRESGWRV